MSKDMQVVNPIAPPSAPVALEASDQPGLPEPESGSHASHEVDPNTELDDLEVRAWRAFLVGHAQVARLLEVDLIATGHLHLAEFEVLFQLGLAENHRLRMNDLANKVVLSRAGMTRLIDRLVADGLVARLKCDSDARGAYAVLTERGHTRLAEARPGHFAAVRRIFLAAFTRPELEDLARLMERNFPAN
jgi:DNA-binding MarR family transcriptional regulator